MKERLNWQRAQAMVEYLLISLFLVSALLYYFDLPNTLKNAILIRHYLEANQIAQP